MAARGLVRVAGVAPVPSSYWCCHVSCRPSAGQEDKPSVPPCRLPTRERRRPRSPPRRCYPRRPLSGRGASGTTHPPIQRGGAPRRRPPGNGCRGADARRSRIVQTAGGLGGKVGAGRGHALHLRAPQLQRRAGAGARRRLAGGRRSPGGHRLRRPLWPLPPLPWRHAGDRTDTVRAHAGGHGACAGRAPGATLTGGAERPIVSAQEAGRPSVAWRLDTTLIGPRNTAWCNSPTR